MSHSYPYSSSVAKEVAEAKAKGVVIDEWRQDELNLSRLIGDMEGLILEIAGPTDGGYYWLDNITLPSPVLITNINQDALPFAPNKDDLNRMVKQLIDGRQLPYDDNSLAMVLSAHLSLIDDHEYDFSKVSDAENDQLNRAIAEVEVLERRAAETGEVDDEVLQKSLRLAIAHEVFHKLRPGGLYIGDATVDELTAMGYIGFTKIAMINIHSIEPELNITEPYFEFVLQKPVML